MRRLHRGSIVDRAARRVPICDVLDWLGIPNPGTPPEGVSIKCLCPFQDTHPQERSGEKDMRIYSDGKGFCHLCAQQWDSVRLASQIWSLTLPEAARMVLARSGLELSEDEELSSLLAKPTPQQLRPGALAALAVWADARSIDRFGSGYGRCLELADQIIEPHHVDAWLSACKKFLEAQSHA
jgi:hypothetical protein